ncbi:XdhC family protein [Streptomyces sp. NPDC015125]
MLDLAAEALHAWSAKAEPAAVATRVSTSGSAPRRPGAALPVGTTSSA